MPGRRDTWGSQSHPSPLPTQITVGVRGALQVALGSKADGNVTKEQTGQASTAISVRPGSGQQAVTASAVITVIHFHVLSRLRYAINPHLL